MILASNMIKQRQENIPLAEESELGWKVVDEYMQSAIASNEEDLKRIHRAQTRARVKANLECGRQAGATCHTHKSQQRLLLIRHISRGHSNSISESKSLGLLSKWSGQALEGQLLDKLKKF